jgi:hypothetical protein
VECETPSAQPTDLILIPGITTITGTFTPSDAEGYLTVMHTESSHSDPPADQTTYSVGIHWVTERSLEQAQEPRLTYRA